MSEGSTTRAAEFRAARVGVAYVSNRGVSLADRLRAGGAGAVLLQHVDAARATATAAAAGAGLRCLARRGSGGDRRGAGAPLRGLRHRPPRLRCLLSPLRSIAHLSGRRVELGPTLDRAVTPRA